VQKRDYDEEIVECVAKKTGLSLNQARSAIAAYEKCVMEIANETGRVATGFGEISVGIRPRKSRRRSITGKRGYTIVEAKFIKFTPSATMKKVLMSEGEKPMRSGRRK